MTGMGSQGFVTAASSFLPTPLMVWGPGTLLSFWSHQVLCLFLHLCSTFPHEVGQQAVATSYFTDGLVKAEETPPKLVPEPRGLVAGLRSFPSTTEVFCLVPTDVGGWVAWVCDDRTQPGRTVSW